MKISNFQKFRFPPEIIYAKYVNNLIKSNFINKIIFYDLVAKKSALIFQ